MKLWLGYLQRLRKSERGITGLETAIILIAFVVVASVFAYTVLSAGIFSSQKGKEAINAGLESARSTMNEIGNVVAKSSNDSTVNEVDFTVANAAGGESIDMSTTTDANQNGLLSDESTHSNVVTISYMDKNQWIGDIAWIKAALGRNNGDNLLDPQEKFDIVVDFTALSPALGANTEFTIEVKPPIGSTLTINRTVPPVVAPVMNLH